MKQDHGAAYNAELAGIFCKSENDRRVFNFMLKFAIYSAVIWCTVAIVLLVLAKAVCVNEEFGGTTVCHIVRSTFPRDFALDSTRSPDLKCEVPAEDYKIVLMGHPDPCHRACP